MRTILLGGVCATVMDSLSLQMAEAQLRNAKNPQQMMMAKTMVQAAKARQVAERYETLSSSPSPTRQETPDPPRPHTPCPHDGLPFTVSWPPDAVRMRDTCCPPLPVILLWDEDNH